MNILCKQIGLGLARVLKKGDHTFEIDEFFGKNKGLVVAEIELTSENENFEKEKTIICLRRPFNLSCI